jgi:hypothetical protein
VKYEGINSSSGLVAVDKKEDTGKGMLCLRLYLNGCSLWGNMCERGWISSRFSKPRPVKIWQRRK